MTSIPSIIVTLLVGGIGGVIGAYGFGALKGHVNLEEEMLLRPRLAIEDFDQAAVLLAGGSSPDDVQRVIGQMRTRIDKLGEKGFIVLDAKAVLAAPPDFFLDPPSLPSSGAVSIAPRASGSAVLPQRGGAGIDGPGAGGLPAGAQQTGKGGAQSGGAVSGSLGDAAGNPARPQP